MQGAEPEERGRLEEGWRCGRASMFGRLPGERRDISCGRERGFGGRKKSGAITQAARSAMLEASLLESRRFHHCSVMVPQLGSPAPSRTGANFLANPCVQIISQSSRRPIKITLPPPPHCLRLPSSPPDILPSRAPRSHTSNTDPPAPVPVSSEFPPPSTNSSSRTLAGS